MKTVKSLKIASTTAGLLLTLLWNPLQIASHAAPNQPVIARTALPVGGEFVENANNKSKPYYFITLWVLKKNAANKKKSAGLYRSLNGGKTWQLMSSTFTFFKVFVHPTTGQLFAIVDVKFMAPNANDVLTRSSSNKAISSKDGRDWKDITGRKDYADMSDIFPDPDNPGRVCLVANRIRNYVLQSTDAAYTHWNWTREWDWRQKR